MLRIFSIPKLQNKMFPIDTYWKLLLNEKWILVRGWLDPAIPGRMIWIILFHWMGCPLQLLHCRKSNLHCFHLAYDLLRF